MEQFFYDYGFLIIIVTGILCITSTVINFMGYRYHKKAQQEYYDAKKQLETK